MNHDRFAHTPTSLHMAMMVPTTKAAVDKEWDQLNTVAAWSEAEFRAQADVIHEAQKTRTSVHFATSWDLCRLKHFVWQTPIDLSLESIVKSQGHSATRTNLLTNYPERRSFSQVSGFPGSTLGLTQTSSFRVKEKQAERHSARARPTVLRPRACLALQSYRRTVACNRCENK